MSINLTEPMKGIYFDSITGACSDYNLSVAYRLTSFSKKEILTCLNKLFYAFPALRMFISHSGNDIAYTIKNDSMHTFTKYENLDGDLDDKINSYACKEFSLTNGSVLSRSVLINCQDDSFVWVLCVHHLICDGISIFKIVNIFNEFLKSTRQGKTLSCDVDDTFMCFLESEARRIREKKYDSQEEYWKSKMQSHANTLIINPDKCSSSSCDHGKERLFEIDKATIQALSSRVRSSGVSLHVLLLGYFRLFASLYCKESDFVFCTPFTQRFNIDNFEAVGNFSSMLPICISIPDYNEHLDDFLKRTHDEVMLCYKNIGYPSNYISRIFNSSHSSPDNSLFDYGFIYDVYDNNEHRHEYLTRIDVANVTFPGKLMFVIDGSIDNLRLRVQYKQHLFTPEMIDCLGHMFIGNLSRIACDGDLYIKEIMHNNENHHLESYGLNYVDYPNYIHNNSASILDIFDVACRSNENNTAIISGEVNLTYRQLDLQSSVLASHIDQLNLDPNATIGVYLHRSHHVITSIIAILKLGASFVLLEPKLPVNRLEYIINDANISTIICSGGSLKLPCDASIIVDLGNINLSSQANSNNFRRSASSNKELCYIAYTSGSTGKPKGVRISYESLFHRISQLQMLYPLNKNECYLFKTSLSFDISLTEIFGWLFNGGRVYVLPNNDEKDPYRILEAIDRYNVTHINFVPTMFEAFLNTIKLDKIYSKCNCLKYIFIGGERLTPYIVDLYISMGVQAQIINMYGPTECTLWATHHNLSNYKSGSLVPIGVPLPLLKCYVLDSNQQLLPKYGFGQLAVSGVGVAEGYNNSQGLTQASFKKNVYTNSFGSDPNHPVMYLTGDLVRINAGDQLEFWGRNDNQIKMHGVRIDPEEIEKTLLLYDKIQSCKVIVNKSKNNHNRLVAFYISPHNLLKHELDSHLKFYLPSDYLPNIYHRLDSLPVTASGKLDIFYLQNLKINPMHQVTSCQNLSKIEKDIYDIWQQELGLSDIDINKNLFELGAHSVMLMNVARKLSNLIGISIPVIILFKYTTIRAIAEYISENDSSSANHTNKDFVSNNSKDIAVVGMSVNVPGAETLDEFWNNLTSNIESIYHYSTDELLDLGLSAKDIHNNNYVRSSGKINGLEYFDNVFFDYNPADVDIMSPQLRMLHKGVWSALDDSGIYPEDSSKIFGMFVAGSDDFSWYKQSIIDQENFVSKYHAFTYATNHFLASRVAYKLNITGPVLSALSACSSSLANIHLARQSLLLGECDIAIAGGVTVELPNEGGYYYQEGMMFSPDGHCRPFDEQAEGTVFSNGMGIVILKRLDEAIKDKDNIYAVLKGTTICNDGSSRLGFASPSYDGQSEMLHRAYSSSGVNPHTISYIEAHGTGTALGDPVEFSALNDYFNKYTYRPRVIGSVKGNIGHTDTAAGAVGFIKTVLSIKNRFIPATLNYCKPNKKINLEKSSFKISSKGSVWGSEHDVLRAGVNSFGVGGTNVHAILEQAPVCDNKVMAHRFYLLIFSSKTDSALFKTASASLNNINTNNELCMSNLEYTLQARRVMHPRRMFFVVDSKQQSIKDALNTLKQINPRLYLPVNHRVYFLFPGQGNQYYSMARDLYTSEYKEPITNIFTKYVESVFDSMSSDTEATIRKTLFSSNDQHKINNTRYSQIAIFLVGYSVAMTLIEIGIKPDGLVGHSVGDITAAAIAGVFSLQHAVALLESRSRIMSLQPGGAMLMVALDFKRVKSDIAVYSDIFISLINSPMRCVVSGSYKSISKYKECLDKNGVINRRLSTSHAFHSPLMQGALSYFLNEISTLKLNEPKIPVLCSTTGQWAKDGELSSHNFWSNHIVNTVNFSDSMDSLLVEKNIMLIEVGPGSSLSSFARQSRLYSDGHFTTHMLQSSRKSVNDLFFFLNNLGYLWSSGVNICWSAVWRDMPNTCSTFTGQKYDEKYFKLKAVHKIDSPKEGLEAGADNKEKLCRKNYSSESELIEKIKSEFKNLLGVLYVKSDDDYFSLGGDSLIASKLCTSFYEHFRVNFSIQDLYNFSTPEKIAEIINNRLSVKVSCKLDSGGDVATHSNHFKLTQAQSRIYTLHRLNPSGLALNLPSAYIINKHIDINKLIKSFASIIKRHSVLRTSIVTIDSEPYQSVQENCDVPVQYLPDTESKSSINSTLESFIKPFELSLAPLFRIGLSKLNDGAMLILFDFHHIIMDGSSAEIITSNFNRLYSNEKIPCARQFFQYAQWEGKQKTLVSKLCEDYWLGVFSSKPYLLNLPYDFQPSGQVLQGGDRVYFNIDSHRFDALNKLAKRSSVSLFHIMIALFTTLLYRYTGQNNILIGTPTSGRIFPEYQDTVGMFVNIIVLLNAVYASDSFIDFLLRVKKSTMMALKHQDMPYNHLVDLLRQAGGYDRNSLFNVSLDFQNIDFTDFAISDLEFSEYKVHTDSSHYDILLTCRNFNSKKTIECFFEYNTSLFTRQTIEVMRDRFINCIDAFIHNPSQLISNVDMLTKIDKQIIKQFICTKKVPISGEISVVSMFYRALSNNPSKVAITAPCGTDLTYSELDKYSNNLASMLHNKSISLNSVVAVILPRNEYLIISMLGVLKAGATYLLIDKKLSDEAIRHMLESSAACCVIIDDSNNALISKLDVSTITARDISAGEYQYSFTNSVNGNISNIIYTSGTTGKPKGIRIKQESLLNYIFDLQVRKMLDADSRIISVTSVSFDIFAFESIASICSGSFVYLASESQQNDPMLVSDIIIKQRITHLLSSVSKIELFSDSKHMHAAFKKLNFILTGGEFFPESLLDRLTSITAARIFNLYGPSEATVWVSLKELTCGDKISIGLPINNTEIYILDKDKNIVPPGIFGEIYIAGIPVADGYLDKHANNKFVQHPHLSSNTMYQTGDIGRYLFENGIEVRGRNDRQVKIRGHRVDLVNIEKAALKIDFIQKSVACIVLNNGIQTLVLYYTLKPDSQADCLEREVKCKLRKIIPDFMFPDRFVLLSSFPYLVNGKIDYKALQSIELNPHKNNDNNSEAYVDHVSEVRKIWVESIHNDDFNENDNFFDAGGNSLSLIKVSNKINKRFHLSLPLSLFFENPTISGFVDNVLRREYREKHDNSKHSTPKHTAKSTDVAVIGMACRFPGASNIDEYWKIISGGVESITTLSVDDLVSSGIPESMLSNADYVMRKGCLDKAEMFDADFFGYSKSEARIMDPQIRIMHQCAWHALEDSGYSPQVGNYKIGVFAGSSSNFLWAREVIKNNDSINAFKSLTYNEKDFLTTRLSYSLGLTGPSCNIQTACSTSLVAVHQAARSIISGECEIALAGGVSLTFPLREGYLWHEGMIFSKDGRCRPFTKSASGTVSGNGCGIVVLKRLDKAIDDCDKIYAVIKGSSVNNDGSQKLGYTAPSIKGQVNVIKEAMNNSGSDSESVCYVEAHGTATKLGDHVEIEALKQAFNLDKSNCCSIGSVKANIGHLDAAAGVAGFIKGVLIAHNRSLPPLVTDKDDTGIDLEHTPFYVATELEEISCSEKIVRVGVSSFGVGGTNAHVIIEQAPVLEKTESIVCNTNYFRCSAENITSLENYTNSLLEFSSNKTNYELSAIADILTNSRKSFSHRQVIKVKASSEDVGGVNSLNFSHSAISNNDSKHNKNIVIYLPSSFKSYIDYYNRMLTISRSDTHFASYLESLSNLCANRMGAYFPANRDVAFDYEYLMRLPLINKVQFCHCVAAVALEMLCNVGVKPDYTVGFGFGELASYILHANVNIDEIYDQIIYAYDPEYDHEKDLLFSNKLGVNGRKLLSSCKKTPLSAIKSNIINNQALAHGSSPDLYIDNCNEEAFLSGISQINSSHNHICIDLLNWDIVGCDEFKTSSSDSNTSTSAEPSTLSELANKLWLCGIDTKYKILDDNNERKSLSIPGYYFSQDEFNLHVSNYDSDNSSVSTPVSQSTPYCSASSQMGPVELRNVLADIWSSLVGGSYPKEENNFFDAGGDSLQLLVLISDIKRVLNIKLDLDVIYKNPTFGAILEVLAHDNSNIDRCHNPIHEQSSHELLASSAQKRIYVACSSPESQSAYNLAALHRVNGVIDIAKFNSVLDTLIKKHESLRTSFKMTSGRLYQHIHASCVAEVTCVEVESYDIERCVSEHINVFDLSVAPLIKCTVFKTDLDVCYLLIDIHHIICDQFSVSVIMQDIKNIYRGIPVSPAKQQYRHYSNSREKYQSSIKSDEDLRRFIKYLSPLPELPVMPTDYIPTLPSSLRSHSVYIQLDDKITIEIDAFCKRAKVTPYAFFMGTFFILLRHLSGADSMLIGTAVTGRDLKLHKDVVGVFANMVPIMINHKYKCHPCDFFRYILDSITSSLRYSDVEYDLLVESLFQAEKIPCASGIFNSVLNYITDSGEKFDVGDFTCEEIRHDSRYAKFKYLVTVVKDPSGYHIGLENLVSEYNIKTVDLILKRYVKIISDIVNGLCESIDDICYLTSYDEQKILMYSNDSYNSTNYSCSLYDIFITICEQNKNSTAVWYNNKSISYLQLQEMINIQSYHIFSCGVMCGDLVALLINDPLEQLVNIFSLLKLGCICAPIDVKYTKKRIHLLLEKVALDCRSAIVSDGLTEQLKLEQIHVINPSEFLEPENKTFIDGVDVAHIDSTHGAFVFFTSGSTGFPKGVVISHKNIISTLKGESAYSFCKGDVVMQISSCAFDGSLFDYFLPLLNEGSLVLKDSSKLDVRNIISSIRLYNVSHVYMPTSVFNMFSIINSEILPSIKKIFFGGEVACAHSVNSSVSVFGAGIITNVYGPTECTFISSYYTFDTLLPENNYVPIGAPLSRTKYYVLDREHKLCPFMVDGELYIGGDGVFSAYLGADTKDMFVDNPYDSSEKLYKTGDIVRYNVDGDLIFSRRADKQVKVRGYRVELLEVESVFLNNKDILYSIVLPFADANGISNLACFVIPKAIIQPDGASQFLQSLKGYASDILPEYMVPQEIVLIESIPYTKNGKIDTNVLLNLVISSKASIMPAVVDCDKVKRAVCGVLSLNDCELHKDIFECGLNSLSAIQLAHELSKLGAEISASDIYACPTIHKIQTMFFDDTKHMGVDQMKNHSRVHNLVLIATNENIDDLIELAFQYNKTLSQYILTLPEEQSFALSPIQSFHLKHKNSSSGCVIKLSNQVDFNLIVDTIAKIVRRNQLLHSVLAAGCWSEKILDDQFNMYNLTPLIDLSNIGGYINDDYISKILSGFYLSDYNVHGLQWRIICVRHNVNTICVYWAFNHICFDASSSIYLKRQFLSSLNDSLSDSASKVGHHHNELAKYDDYVNQLSKVSSKGITLGMLDKYNLPEWGNSLDDYIRSYAKLNINDPRSIKFKVNIGAAQIQELSESIFSCCSASLLYYFKLSTLPMLVVCQARKLENMEYFNCIGEFLDLMPVCVSKYTTLSDISSLSGYASKNAINFLSLECISKEEKFCALKDILSKGFCMADGSLNPIVFNYRGFVDHDDNDLMSKISCAEQIMYSKCSVTVEHDNDSFYVEIRSQNGISCDDVIKYFNDELIKHEVETGGVLV